MSATELVLRRRADGQLVARREPLVRWQLVGHREPEPEVPYKMTEQSRMVIDLHAVLYDAGVVPEPILVTARDADGDLFLFASAPTTGEGAVDELIALARVPLDFDVGIDPPERDDELERKMAESAADDRELRAERRRALFRCALEIELARIERVRRWTAGKAAKRAALASASPSTRMRIRVRLPENH